LVKIDYTSKRITLYNDKPNSLKKNTKSFAKFPISFIDNKPYLSCNAFFEKDSASLASKLLIDTGNSDAIWFFSQNDSKIVVPKTTFEDFWVEALVEMFLVNAVGYLLLPLAILNLKIHWRLFPIPTLPPLLTK